MNTLSSRVLCLSLYAKQHMHMLPLKQKLYTSTQVVFISLLNFVVVLLPPTFQLPHNHHQVFFLIHVLGAHDQNGQGNQQCSRKPVIRHTELSVCLFDESSKFVGYGTS